MPEAWNGKDGLAAVAMSSHLHIIKLVPLHVDKQFDVLVHPTTQEYGSVSIATVLLCSWGRPNVGWTRWRYINAFAFAAANCLKISTD